MSNVINIREFVDVTTSVAATPSEVSRNWGAVLFVQKGTDAQATEITRHDDLAAVIAAEGSNSEAAKFATKFYGARYAGVSPSAPVYVAKIGMASLEEFQANFTALLGSEDYYLIALDANCTAEFKKAAASLNEANQKNATHCLFLDDNSDEAVSKSLEEDILLGASMSVAAFCKNNKYTKTIVAWVNPSNENQYYSAAMASYFSTRKFENSSRKMATLAHKPCSGIEPVNFADSQVTERSADACWRNLDAKNASAYINVKLVGLSAWERCNAPEGGDLSEYISADFLNYTISVSVFQLLQSVPRLAMNQDGAGLLANALDSAFNNLYQAGVIGAGISLDGEQFSGKGYHYSIPIPTGVNKANGLWDGIVCTALLTGSCKKVVIGNTLEK